MELPASKIKEWLWRYTPAELISLAATLLGAWITYMTTGSRLSASIAGTICGNIGYFGTILLHDIIKTKRQFRHDGRQYNLTVFLKNVRALFIEFGLAEVLDTFFIRPFLLYKMPLWLGNLTLGWIVAKFLADVTFYLPSIVFYEWSKNRYRKF